MPSYLIDSDILVDFFRQNASAMNYLDSLGDWSVSIVTAMELIAGAKNKQEAAGIETTLGAYRIFSLSEDIGNLGYNLMKSYAKSDGLETPDALIAATAIHEGLKLATTNRKHFENIGALEIEVPEY
jgi:predicted nucleic acid-binding protein